MIKIFKKCFIFHIGGFPEGMESKGLDTHSIKLRPMVILPRKVADPFEKNRFLR